MRYGNRLKSFALLLTLLACDSTMSQWDTVRVKLAAANALSLINAGEDIITNVEFQRSATTQLKEPLTYSWNKVSGPGNIMFGDASSQETSIAADEDGVYEIRVTARNEWGDETFDSFQLTWDTTGPVAPSALRTRAGSLSGDDVRITNQTTIVLDWDEAKDTGIGIRDYTVTWYAGANCAGFETTVTGLTNSHHTVSGNDGETISYKITAFDKLDQSSTSACSPNVTIDTTLPPALTAFTGVTGNVVGGIKLTLTLPADDSDYASIVLRRAAGATAPVDCNSGIIAKTFAKTDLSASITYTDLAPAAGAVYSYRACIADLAGNELAQNTTTNHQSKAHYIFVSSEDMDGKFNNAVGGLAAADQVCRSLVLAAGVLPVISEELNWKAVISSSGEAASNRIQLIGKVLATDGTMLANDANDFWDGTLASFVGNDEKGGTPPTDFVWTGTDNMGSSTAQTCNNWTSNSGTQSATVGNLSSQTLWLNDGSAQCDQNFFIYCINQRSN